MYALFMSILPGNGFRTKEIGRCPVADTAVNIVLRSDANAAVVVCRQFRRMNLRKIKN